MFSKNLKYYRLKKNLSKKELAELVGVSPMAITHYENGTRKPVMDVIKALAKVLDVRVIDFLGRRNTNLVFEHGEFRKKSSLSKTQQDFVRENVEEYMGRFFSSVEILGGEVLPEPPGCNNLVLAGDAEADAAAMRRYLKISESGPVEKITGLLENKGILVYYCDLDNDAFSGINGKVNGRPYIVINSNMSPERIRSTIVHEMAHFMFDWSTMADEKEREKYATAISGAFLFSKEDAVRELGIRRTSITNDMKMVCKEYGISMYLLAKRARLCGIINESAEKNFYINANKMGWKKNEPARIERETPTLFSQLVFRAVSENEISIQKGAELLKTSYEDVEKNCFAAG